MAEAFLLDAWARGLSPEQWALDTRKLMARRSISMSMNDDLSSSLSTSDEPPSQTSLVLSELFVNLLTQTKKPSPAILGYWKQAITVGLINCSSFLQIFLKKTDDTSFHTFSHLVDIYFSTFSETTKSQLKRADTEIDGLITCLLQVIIRLIDFSSNFLASPAPELSVVPIVCRCLSQSISEAIFVACLVFASSHFPEPWAELRGKVKRLKGDFQSTQTTKNHRTLFAANEKCWKQVFDFFDIVESNKSLVNSSSQLSLLKGLGASNSNDRNRVPSFSFWNAKTEDFQFFHLVNALSILVEDTPAPHQHSQRLISSSSQLSFSDLSFNSSRSFLAPNSNPKLVSIPRPLLPIATFDVVDFIFKMKTSDPSHLIKSTLLFDVHSHSPFHQKKWAERLMLFFVGSGLGSGNTDFRFETDHNLLSTLFTQIFSIELDLFLKTTDIEAWTRARWIMFHRIPLFLQDLQKRFLTQFDNAHGETNGNSSSSNGSNNEEASSKVTANRNAFLEEVQSALIKLWNFQVLINRNHVFASDVIKPYLVAPSMVENLIEKFIISLHEHGLILNIDALIADPSLLIDPTKDTPSTDSIIDPVSCLLTHRLSVRLQETVDAIITGFAASVTNVTDASNIADIFVRNFDRVFNLAIYFSQIDILVDSFCLLIQQIDLEFQSISNAHNFISVMVLFLNFIYNRYFGTDAQMTAMLQKIISSKLPHLFSTLLSIFSPNASNLGLMTPKLLDPVLLSEYVSSFQNSLTELMVPNIDLWLQESPLQLIAKLPSYICFMIHNFLSHPTLTWEDLLLNLLKIAEQVPLSVPIIRTVLNDSFITYSSLFADPSKMIEREVIMSFSDRIDNNFIFSVQFDQLTSAQSLKNQLRVSDRFFNCPELRGSADYIEFMNPSARYLNELMKRMIFESIKPTDLLTIKQIHQHLGTDGFLLLITKEILAYIHEFDPRNSSTALLAAEAAGVIVSFLGKAVARHYLHFVLAKNLVSLQSLVAAKVLGKFVIVSCFMSRLFGAKDEVDEDETTQKKNESAKIQLFQILSDVFQQATQRSSPHIVFGFYVLVELVTRSPHSLSLANRQSLTQSLSKLRLSQLTPLFFDFSNRSDLLDFVKLLDLS